MEIKENCLITLSNDEQFVVLKETMYENERYFLVMGFNEKKEIDSSKVCIFKEEKDKEEVYLVKIEDANLLSTLMELLKKGL